MGRTYEELVAEAASAPVEGWDFSWLDGRATEARPSWGYQRLMGERMARAEVALDIQTGGGEVLAGVPRLAPFTVATESWAPNAARARDLLNPRGAAVVEDADEPPLPFRDETFDLVVSRHPVTVWWAEIARVLRPGGTYFSQQVGPESVFELAEFFLGDLPEEAYRARRPEDARAGAEAAGLRVVDLRSERLPMTFLDVGAVIYFLRKVIWIVPGFTVERHADRLRAMHDHIQREGRFVAHSARFLIEAAKPA
ncbi:class I SAM-dependent methyltransferase [Bailinhaonella thermotolerans]|uniref:SAM-dependent methyltransferase n=1 Tax=Bailinhaonella thermotolerans TaxID=1070861 RepID=A0A3A4A9Q2_9ACTN|nr:class I SAM-dependent methyltransferase [Bailinhaonella thermotolerans]RJL22056.1 SAM-dependent methyltransferase [Bailinhaonella thermotolerans]